MLGLVQPPSLDLVDWLWDNELSFRAEVTARDFESFGCAVEVAAVDCQEGRRRLTLCGITLDIYWFNSTKEISFFPPWNHADG
jgi:hypothetical protein